MDKSEKELVKNLFHVIKGLQQKVKLHDDIIERVLLDNPHLIRPDTWLLMEGDVWSISDSEIAALEKQVNEL